NLHGSKNSRNCHTSYSYLMLMLQNVWNTKFIEDEKKINECIIGELPTLIRGVLKPIVMLLTETPVSTNQYAKVTFRFYDFNESKNYPKQQLKNIINLAYKTNDTEINNILKNVSKVVELLPEAFLK
ncbi:7127_t:CDS:2, partial [Diversispora eburnea]